jgi:hypothetical protein
MKPVYVLFGVIVSFPSFSIVPVVLATFAFPLRARHLRLFHHVPLPLFLFSHID